MKTPDNGALGMTRVRVLGRWCTGALAVIAAAGCAQLPHQQVVTGPTTATPVESAVQTTNGSIFQAAYDRPLFEDPRPRRVGDTLTVVFNEKLAASKSSSAKADRKSSGTFGINKSPKILGSGLGNNGFDMSGGNDFQGSGGADASNTFTGQMAVTVIRVQANGNLSVAGEKHIGINQGTEYVLFSGIVDPRLIQGDGTVASTQIANARLEYYGKGYMDEAQHMGWLQRFLLNIAPF